MSDKQKKEVVGVVMKYYPSEGENDPHNVYVDSEDDRFSTFNDATVDPIEESIKIGFVAEQNNGHWNIVDNTVTVVDCDPDIPQDDTETGSVRSSEGVQKSGDGAPFESPRARSIWCNVALKQAWELCQPLMHEDESEARVREIREMVLETT